MRLMTWNCQVGGFRRKGARAAALRPTVLVVPESENIDGEMVLAGDVQPTTRMWLGGTTTKRGVGVLSYTGAAIHKARRIGDPIDFFVPLEVSADGVEFQVVAVWTAATTDRATRYRQADEGLDRYADWIRRRGTVVMGDFNTAHRAVDLARPKANEKTSGFRPEEREELDRWLRSGFVDTFRSFEQGPGHYSWWSQRFGVREKNVGWRLDYVLASEGAMPFVKRAFLEPHTLGSDHCPAGVELDDAVVG